MNKVPRNAKKNIAIILDTSGSFEEFSSNIYVSVEAVAKLNPLSSFDIYLMTPDGRRIHSNIAASDVTERLFLDYYIFPRSIKYGTNRQTLSTVIQKVGGDNSLEQSIIFSDGVFEEYIYPEYGVSFFHGLKGRTKGELRTSFSKKISNLCEKCLYSIIKVDSEHLEDAKTSYYKKWHRILGVKSYFVPKRK